MNALGLLARSVRALCPGAAAALFVFGPLLGLTWLPGFSEHLAHKMVTLLLATGTSLVVGGYVAGLLPGHNTEGHGLALGLLLGLVAFGYVLGPDWPPVCRAALRSAGCTGWLADRRGRAASAVRGEKPGG